MTEKITDYDPAKDNQEAHDVINKCLVALGERLEALEKACAELPTPDKTYYKPDGYEEYLNLKGNYDEIYRRIKELEEQAHPAPSTNHGKRLTALEEKVNGMQSLED